MLRIGDVTFHEKTHVLANGSSEQKLEPRAAAVLSVLARRPGEVVSKQALIDAVWHGHAVADHSVAVVVSDLRRALGDNPKAPVYIQTVSKEGYRLIAPVAPARRTGTWWIAAALLVALASSWIWIGHRDSTSVIVTDIGNATGDEDAVYIAQAFSETLPIELAAVLESSVVRWRASTSEAPDDVPVLSGRIITTGATHTLALRLERARNGAILWGDTFDLNRADFGGLSRRIASDVATAIEGRSNGPARGNEIPPEVHELYWRARYLWSLREHEAIRSAIAQLSRAIEIEPRFALAHVALADIYAHKTAEELGLDRVDTFQEAVRHLEHARQLEPELPELDVTEALLEFYRDRDRASAMAAIRRALHRQPRSAASWQTLAMVASALGEHDEAIAAIDHARTLDPLAASILWDRVWFLYVAGRTDAAREAAREARRVTAPVHVYEALIYEAIGDRERALEARIARARDRGLGADDEARLRALDIDDAYDALAAMAGDAYREADVPRAALELQAGDSERALTRLSGARPGPQAWWWHWVGEMPAFDELHESPAFQQTLARLRSRS